MASKLMLRVSVVYCPVARQVHEVYLTLKEPATLLQALQQSGLLAGYPELLHPHNMLGIWGRKASAGQLLRDQDRVEVYRALRVDPKVARRERFVKQGTRSAGLFSKKSAVR